MIQEHNMTLLVVFRRFNVLIGAIGNLCQLSGILRQPQSGNMPLFFGKRIASQQLLCERRHNEGILEIETESVRFGCRSVSLLVHRLLLIDGNDSSAQPCIVRRDVVPNFF